jgi:mRNA interferase RelE/StbE
VVVNGDPRSVGQASKGSEPGELWKYRIGGYRVIAEVEDSVLRVPVVRVGNRKDAYR